MRDIKVFLQYPWKFPDSAYCKNMLVFPPGGINCLNKNFTTNKFRRRMGCNSPAS